LCRNKLFKCTLKNSPKSFKRDKRVRLPRAFGIDGTLNCYSSAHSFASYVLKRASIHDRSLDNERAYSVITDASFKRLYLITTNYLIKVQFSEYNIRWKYELRYVQRVACKEFELCFHIQAPEKRFKDHMIIKRVKYPPSALNIDNFTNQLQLAIDDERNSRMFRKAAEVSSSS
jgi:hypothetical protein